MCEISIIMSLAIDNWLPTFKYQYMHEIIDQTQYVENCNLCTKDIFY